MIRFRWYWQQCGQDDDGDGLSDLIEGESGLNPLTPDTDGDGIIDGQDAFPAEASETLDTDGDGIGNNADIDDDGDKIADAVDLDPLDATVHPHCLWGQIIGENANGSSAQA